MELIVRDPFFELWSVRATATGQPAFWKQARPEWEQSHTLRQLLAHEEKITRQIDSPHCLKILSCSDSSAPTELLFEHCDAASLQSILHRRTTCSVESTLWIARQVAEALEQLERAGFIHANLETRSVLVHRSGRITLTGLILAQRAGCVSLVDLSAEFPLDPEMQSSRAPERGSSSPSRIAWDLYSLGALMYRLLTGKSPWPGSTALEISQLQRTSSPAPLRQLAPHVPRDVAEFIGPLLARQPLSRPESWRQVIDRLIALEIHSLPATG